MQSLASDHIDSPTVTQDRGSDIADLWAFLDPNDNSQVILALSTQGFVVSGEHFGMVIFDSNIRYHFDIENTGDAVPDMTLDVLYTPGLGRLTTQTATIKLKTRADAGRSYASINAADGRAVAGTGEELFPPPFPFFRDHRSCQSAFARLAVIPDEGSSGATSRIGHRSVGGRRSAERIEAEYGVWTSGTR